jgi:hypothetical protein
MSQNKIRKPILIRDEGGVQTFRDPKTGKEFSTTISKPVPNADLDNGLVSVECVIREDEEIPKQLAALRSVIGSDVVLNNQQMLADARSKRAVTVSGLRIWRADQIVEAMKRIGFSANVVQE